MNSVISELESFKRLDDDDQANCLEAFNVSLRDRQLMNKYLKRTAEIADKLPELSNEDKSCFLTIDLISPLPQYSSLVLMLNGIFQSYRYVIYYNVMSLPKVTQTIGDFVCDILINVMVQDIPKLTGLSLKFVLCKRTSWMSRALTVMRSHELGVYLFQQYTFAYDAMELQRMYRLSRDASKAFGQLLYSAVNDRNIQDNFEKHRQKFRQRRCAALERFVQEYHQLARSLLQLRDVIFLNDCSYRRSVELAKLVVMHFQTLNGLSAGVSRMYVFSCIRAILIIFDY